MSHTNQLICECGCHTSIYSDENMKKNGCDLCYKDDVHYMPHTNQLIEEFDKFWEDNNLSRLEIDRAVFYPFLSQTEQECDKKWRERIRGKRRDNVFVPDHSPSMHGGLVCRACGGQEDCRCEYYNEAIDDLLNNK